ncbi:MAG TPA: excinuclease ABC subunit UvrA, partial [Vicinamibacteria bacterium]|nr:excinuclease ABC subunit UvrA [Vicinamibacteria bacterium]
MVPVSEEFIDARGVRVHNLKGIDVRIPLRKLVVLTGVSGSGKSSLAFDTLYAEGQRRYVESLSAYARQFLERLDRPDVDEIEGICPAIALRQRPPGRNPRSTVATATEIHDHLRLLYAHAGVTTCGACGGPVARDTAEAVAERLAGHGDARLLVAFPVNGGGTRDESIAALLRRGFRRVLDPRGAVLVLDDTPPEAVAALEDPLLAVVDRVSASAGRARLVDSIETAFREGGGRAAIHVAEGPLLRVSDAFACLSCGRPAEPPTPRLFSFNHAEGACPSCHGFGNLIQIDEGLVVPDPRKTLEGGAVEPWTRPRHKAVAAELRRFARRRAIPLDVSWRDLAEEHRRLVLEGDEEFPGVIGFFRRLESRKYQVQVRVFLSRYRGYRTCPACVGSRLRPEALRVRVAGRTIAEVSALTVESALAFLESVALTGGEAHAAGRVLDDLRRRMRLLHEVGLDYLTLDRPFGTLSGGEAQRVALATALGTGLVGTLYVLDEPSVGLHPRDTGRLIGVLRALRDQGSSVLVVEHERSVMAVADHVVDLGPGAGEQGGRVVFEGTYEQLLRDGRSLTAKYLRGELSLPAPPPRKRRKPGPAIVVRGARSRNLRGVTARFPLGVLTCVTGVSGSGKSTLVHDVLCAAILQRLGRWDRPVGAHDAVEGASGLRDVVLVDQSPVGRTPRSNPVTYVKAFDAIREVYASTREARQRSLGAGDFSFNVPGGRCETCAGDGQVRVDMQFLADVALVCETCGGRRYRPPVLEVRWRGRTIDQVLEMTVHEALHFFAGQAAVARRLKLLEAIGLGYLRLGQSATSLSGGEAQRLKLAVHLSRRDVDRTLFVLDEPTSGLHMADVAELMKALERLLERGATLVVIEHDMDIVAR